MAKLDFKLVSGPGPVLISEVDDRTTSSQTVALQPGEPVKKAGNFVIALATGDPEVGTDEFVGIVRKQSTETSSVDGKVEVYCTVPGQTILRAKMTTGANADTLAELLGLIGDWICADVTGAGTNGPTGVFTIDEDEGDDPNVHGFKVIRGNIARGTLDFIVHSMATQAGTTI